MSKKPKDNRWDDAGGKGVFFLPYDLLRHENYRNLSPHGHKLIADLATQYSGFNNGYMSPAWALMKDRGWKSSETLWLAVLECEHYQLIVKTQQGDKRRPNLYAFTFRRIDAKPGHDLLLRPTAKPPNYWTELKPPFVKPAPRPKKRGRRPLRVAA